MSGGDDLSIDLRCPDDGHLLRTRTDQPVPYADCAHCDGVWLSREALETPGRISLPLERRRPFAARQDRECPQCWARMEEIDLDGFVIDECPKCGGVWLDPGELRPVRQRAAAERIARQRPSLKGPSSRAMRLWERLVDVFGLVAVEEEAVLLEKLPDVDPRSWVPPRRRPK